MTHLFVAVTAHGYGHLAQVAPVVAELAQRRPGLEVTLQARVAPAFVRDRLPPGVRLLQHSADVALPMRGPLAVDWAAGIAAYSAFEAEYPAHLQRQCALFEELQPDLVLADIPWLPLDAARRLGIPCAGLCSLNWHDILLEGPLGAEVPAAVARRLRAVYAGADLFLRPQPAMPMAWLPNGRDIGPIARPQLRAPARLRAQLGLPAGERLVLMQFGGSGRLALGGGPRLMPGVRLLTPDAAAGEGRDDVRVIGGAEGPSVLEALASCDVILTKPGYGTFAEAACSGIPVLSVARPEWPETPWLVDWLRARVALREIDAAALAEGRVQQPLAELLAQGPVPPVPPSGVAEAADALLALLARH